MDNPFENHIGTAGDMASGSQNPGEHNDWLDKQQRERERQQKARERQQPNPNRTADGFTAPATGLTPVFDNETAVPKSEPLKIEPLKAEIPNPGLSPAETPKPAASGTGLSNTGTAGTASPTIDLSITPEDAYTTFGKTWGEQKLIGIYDTHPVPHREQPEEWYAALARRARHIPTLSPDVQECLFRFHCQTNPPFRQKIQDEIRQTHRVMPDIRSGSAQSPTGNAPSEAFIKPPQATGETPPQAMEETGRLPSLIAEEKARQMKVEPAEKKVNLLEQGFGVNHPEDMSLNPVIDFVNDHALDILGDNPSWKANPPGHSDLSYKAFGETLSKSAQSALGEASAIHGSESNRTVGPADESYAPLIGDVSDNLGTNSAVTGHGREIISAPNQSYWVNWEDEQGRQIPFDLAARGVKQGLEDAKALFYSGAALAGDLVYQLVGGDDKALRHIQALVEEQRKAGAKRPRLSIDQLYVENDAEKTMQNITQYLYQELGNQIVNVPAYIVLGHLKTFAELTGVSTAVMAAQIHGDIREKTGEGKPVESVLYAVPLGLMSALRMPFRQAGALKGAQEVRNYVGGLLVGFGVHMAQQEQEKMIVRKYPKNPHENL